MTKKQYYDSAFTIVELLVVLVVIGILAAISFVSYAGINERAISARITSDLNNDAKLLELYKVENDVYPSSLGVNNCPATPTPSTNYCLVVSGPDDTLTYVGGGNDYTLTITDHGSDKAYEIVPGGTVVAVDGGFEPPAFDYMKAVGGVDEEYGSVIVQTSDGGYAVTGYTYSFGAGDSDAYIAKFDSNQDLSWMKTWGTAGYDCGYSIVQTSDGGYAITGEASDYDTGETDMFIAKFDSTGVLSWDKIWGGTSYASGSSIIQTSDDGFAVTGYTYKFGSADNDYDMFIAKFSSTGILSWDRTWGGDYDEYGYSIIQASDGGYAVTGSTSIYDTEIWSDMFIAKFDSTGNLSWNKTWGGAADDIGYSIIQASDGGYAVTGSANELGTGGSDMFIAKFDSTGNLSWDKIWGGTDYDGGYSITQTSDDGYAVTGSTISFDSGSQDMFITKFSSTGTLSWEKTWGGVGSDHGSSIVQTSDSGYAIIGYTNSYGAGDNDMFIVKYNSSGVIPDCSGHICRDLTADVSSPTAIVSSLGIGAIVPESEISDSSATSDDAAATVTSIDYMYTSPNADIVFHSGELRVEYPGENKTVCKEWSLPSFDYNGRYISGFYVNQDTELNYDYFTVSIDGTEVYRQSGDYANTPVDVSSMHGETVRVCMQTDSQNNSGFGGEVTGIDYYIDAL